MKSYTLLSLFFSSFLAIVGSVHAGIFFLLFFSLSLFFFVMNNFQERQRKISEQANQVRLMLCWLICLIERDIKSDCYLVNYETLEICD